MRKLFAVVCALLMMGLPAMAQARAQLTIQCNQSGAQVFVAGRMMGNTSPNVVISLPVGTYQIKVIKTGYQDFDTTINLPAGGLVLPVTLVQKGAAVAPTPTPVPAPQTFALQVLAPRPNAEVIINGQSKGNAPVTVQVPAGQYTVQVRAPGMLEFKQTVTVNGPVTVNAGAMQPMTQQLSVTANVAGAQVLINGNPAGQVPFTAQLTPGSYTVTVRAPNFLDFTQNVVVSGPVQVNANLQPMTFQLNATATNVPGAQVLLNGNPAGQSPFAAQLAPGSYTLTIRAPGFIDYTESFAMAAPKTVSVALQPSMASWQVVLPAANVNADMKGGHWSQIQIYIDGVIQKDPMGQVAPGRRLVKVTAGGLKVETFIDFVAGRSYVIEPSMAVTIK